MTINLSRICIILIFLTTIGKCNTFSTERIAFIRFHEATPINSTEIHIMDTDGSNITQLTFSGSHSYDPAWSPDGTHIAFTSRRTGKQYIYIMTKDGSDVFRLTDETSFAPAWSPDGKRIAFVCVVDNIDQICVIDTDGSNRAQLTNGGVGALHISWSPDGAHILFGCSPAPVQICAMDADGSNQTRLTQGPGANFWPVWSPDGTQIAFVSNRHSINYEVFIMDADGSNATQLTSSIREGRSPSWSPNGQKIVFTCDDGICIISLNKKHVHQITDYGLDPAWIPVR